MAARTASAAARTCAMRPISLGTSGAVTAAPIARAFRPERDVPPRTTAETRKCGDSLHQHFYHWIRGYYSATQEYIQTVQNKEPAQWDHIKRLSELTSSVERRKTKTKREHALTEEEVPSFLDDEIELDNSGQPAFDAFRGQSGAPQPHGPNG